MEVVIFIILALAVVLLAVWLSRSRQSPRTVLPGIRREAAEKRFIPKPNQHLFTREVMAGHRRFFFDVDEGDRGKYLRISELESQKGQADHAYTVIVFEREILGFQKALNDAAQNISSKSDLTKERPKI